MLLSWENAQDI